jgi:hypothetical protein
MTEKEVYQAIDGSKEEPLDQDKMMFLRANSEPSALNRAVMLFGSHRHKISIATIGEDINIIGDKAIVDIPDRRAPGGDGGPTAFRIKEVE